MPRKDTDPAKRRALLRRKRAKLPELHAQGLSANRIAKQLGVNASTVSRWAKADGLKFDRAEARHAIRARQVDLAALRAEASQLAIETALEELRDIRGPYEHVAPGPNGPVRMTLVKPLAADRRNLATSAAVLIDKHVALARFDGDGSEGERSMLAELGRALGIT